MKPSTLSPELIPRSRRRYYLLGLLALAVGLAVALYARHVFQTVPPAVAVTDTAGVAQFNFRVTGIPVPGVVPGLRAKVLLDPQALAGAHGTVTVDLSRLSTGLALRDEHARGYLGVVAHPTATFTLDRLDGLTAIAPGERKSGVARGTLLLNGRPHALQAPIDLDFTRPAALEVAAHFNVAFKDYAIDIPGADPATDVTAKFRLPVAP